MTIAIRSIGTFSAKNAQNPQFEYIADLGNGTNFDRKINEVLRAVDLPGINATPGILGKLMS